MIVNQSFNRKYLGEFVYGAIDGTITTFAIITGVVGAALSPTIILVLGFANVLADGFSMGASNYLSTKSEQDLGVIKEQTPLSTALVTFVSFILVGSIPLLPFVFGAFGFFDSHIAVKICMFVTGLVFLSIGAIKGIVTGKGKIKSSLETLLVGGFAAGISFYVGHILQGLA